MSNFRDILQPNQTPRQREADYHANERSVDEFRGLLQVLGETALPHVNPAEISTQYSQVQPEPFMKRFAKELGLLDD